MADWYWDGETDRWRLIQAWQRWYPKRGWVSDRIELSVAGSPDAINSSLRACASLYATKIGELEK